MTPKRGGFNAPLTDIEVQLTDTDEAFVALARVRLALWEGGRKDLGCVRERGYERRLRESADDVPKVRARHVGEEGKR
jgi:hypothetical protein